ncbi:MULTISPECIES: PAS domain-containing sensor histidine kinase [unclassified Massilia]|uniref:sensor histidine kinase n=1 Tax=unclassified Massilia TaxID=2609279 RepID=UPI001782A048|nr:MULTISPECIES: ATP-binding protein [unclassified Massilia]MBD8530818.1 PAS domain-containing protein [Massilia sp. CFBP 13647]MBD8674517.1 PAS domain-containing protein [Massilia sp. CFBP 13721]
MTERQVLSTQARATFWRSLQALTVTRIVIALVLLLYLAFDVREGGVRAMPSYAPTCFAYLGAAVVFSALTVFWRRRFTLQLTSQIALDLAVISLLYLAAGGVRSGLGILYLFPLAGAAILAPLVPALFSAALATLFVLVDATWQLWTRDGEPALMQAGMIGSAFFAVVWLVNRLAARLIDQEELAAQRGIDLQVQQAINEIVVADVGDGVLVVGSDGRIHTANPAARRMLGMETVAGLQLDALPGLEPVAHAFAGWLGSDAEGPATLAAVEPVPGAAGPDTAYVILKPYQEVAVGETGLRARRDQPAHIKLRFARVAAAGGILGRSVIFLQDVSAIENQAQQLKLASMGRLTASIAHEVRNPLSAIGHATALLAEDLHGKAEVRLLKIIGDNVARVNRMVEDILQLSRKAQPYAEPVQLAPFLLELKAEFCETQGLPDEMVWLGGAGAIEVRFDALHLREVLVNLLGNAIRYASRQPSSIRIWPELDAFSTLELHVQDDGPGITAEVRAHLFEPFYTTSSKGTGLGLYLARELCLNNGAKLDYEARFDTAAPGARQTSGRFVITFAQESNV